MTIASPAACIIGWPAAHSRSPLIHRFWLKAHGIDGDYRIEAVPPENFASFIAHLGQRGYAGANVTIPHKEQALNLSAPDDRARAVGAANTLWFDGDVLRSTNTDVEGFINNLRACVPDWNARGTALVLGAGGSARAVVYGLLEQGAARVDVVNRTQDKAEALRATFGDKVHAHGWDALAALMKNADLLVNTTSLGMKGQPPLPIDLASLPPHAVVADLVYVPLQTALLEAAQARGLQVADGLGMLLYQAVRGFALWFGLTPQVTPDLRKLIEDDLARKV